MNLTLQQWDSLQERAVNPFRSNESNAVNRLTRVVTLGNDYVIKEHVNKNNAQLLDYKTITLVNTHYIKDDVYIHFKEDADLDFLDPVNYLVTTEQAMDKNGIYKIVMHYVYTESLPHPVATFKILKPGQDLTSDVLLLCNAIVSFNNTSNIFEITSINFDNVPYLYINVLFGGGGAYNTNTLFETILPGIGRYLKVTLPVEIPDYKLLLSVRKDDENKIPNVGEVWYSRIDNQSFRLYNSGSNKVDNLICQLSSETATQIKIGDLVIENIPDTPPAVVTFTITADGTPITDAVITFAGMTNPAGSYTFGVYQETYNYSIVASGYNVKTGELTVTGDMTHNIDMEITTDTVIFKVFVGTAPFTGATITYNGVTNPTGNYTFQVVPGTYNYTVTAPGYDTVNGTQVSSASTTNITLIEAAVTFNLIEIEDTPTDKTVIGETDSTNVFVLYYKSDPFGAQANFGNVTIQNYDHSAESKDIILLIDKNNVWGELSSEVNDAFTSGIQTVTGVGSLILIRPDPINQTGTNSILIKGATKTFGTRLTALTTVHFELEKANAISDLNTYITSLLS